MTSPTTAADSQTAAHADLLRRYEPIIHFSQGERFFPMDVQPYVEACSLWAQRPDEEPVCIVNNGELTLERLSQPRYAEFGTVYYLEFTKPATAARVAADNLSELLAKDKFRAGRGRLARVGYASRIIDALFSVTLLARGRVPGDKAAAAKDAYQLLQQNGLAHRYHGRVVERDGWIVLQYWYFYLYNNWRSGFYGANDHEADWEMVCIYLADRDDGDPTPEWVAYASHDYSGDDLRRRWDDPELERMGSHPVIYAGAGSHASYFQRGEYLTEIELPILKPLVRVSRLVQDFWYDRLRQYRGEQAQARMERGTTLFHVPFVDYARGDGLIIGPHPQAGEPWAKPVVIDATDAWVSNYRGLWGLYAQDPFAGEDAPAGPMYNRDGSVRLAWADPLAWAGLNKLPPPHKVQDNVEEQRRALSEKRVEMRKLAAAKTKRLQDLQVEAAALRGQTHLEVLYEKTVGEVGVLSAEITTLRAEIAETSALIDAVSDYLRRLRNGDREPMRAHIHRAHTPASDSDLRFSRLAEFWAAISVGMTLIGVVALYRFFPEYRLAGIAGIVALLTFIEAGFRGRLTQLITAVTLLLALAGSTVLLIEFFDEFALVAVLAAGGYILLGNLRELWR